MKADLSKSARGKFGLTTLNSTILTEQYNKSPECQKVESYYTYYND